MILEASLSYSPGSGHGEHETTLSVPDMLFRYISLQILFDVPLEQRVQKIVSIEALHGWEVAISGVRRDCSVRFPLFRLGARRSYSCCVRNSWPMSIFIHPSNDVAFAARLAGIMLLLVANPVVVICVAVSVPQMAVKAVHL